MTSLPVIGITAAIVDDPQDYGTMRRHRVSADYSEAVLAAGGLPVILPPLTGAIDGMLDLVDGLIFSGGADIDPALYGDSTVHPATYDISADRDRFEIDLMRGAIERDVPVLCICRGIQVLNVALGGTLIQHIDDGVESALPHRQHEVGYMADATSHEIRVEPGTLTAEVLGLGTLAVNSLHHQAIADPAPSVRIEALAQDGVIEAVSVPKCRFVLGLQWHPELLFEKAPAHARPFEALVAAARVPAAATSGV